jgi:hypothetical protein
MNPHVMLLLARLALSVYAACALMTVFVMRKVVRPTGRVWILGRLFSNFREERRALRNLPKGRLHTELRIIDFVAGCSWLLGTGIVLTQSYKK